MKLLSLFILCALLCSVWSYRAKPGRRHNNGKNGVWKSKHIQARPDNRKNKITKKNREIFRKSKEDASREEFGKERDERLSMVDAAEKMMNKKAMEDTESRRKGRKSPHRKRNGKRGGRRFDKEQRHDSKKFNAKQNVKKMGKHSRLGMRMKKQNRHIDYKCANFTVKIEMMCEKMRQVKSNPFVKSVMNRWSKETSNKIASWKICCEMEDETERVTCFRKVKTAKIDRICDTKMSGKFEKCCNATGEARVSCFDDFEQQACNASATTQQIVEKEEKPTKSKFRGNKHNIAKALLQRKRQFHNKQKKWKGKMRKDDETDRKWEIPYCPSFSTTGRKTNRDKKRCCEAAFEISERSDANLTVKFCEKRFESWAANRTDLPESCADRFVSCCIIENEYEDNIDAGTTNQLKTPKKKMAGGKKHGRPYRRGKQRPSEVKLDAYTQPIIDFDYNPEPIEYPNETGQMIEEHMEEPKYNLTFANPEEECCAAAKNITGFRNRRVCKRKLMQFASEWPQVDKKCTIIFLKCCMKKEPRITKNSREKNSVENPKKIDKVKKPGSRYGKNGENLPHGMKMTPEGHYYFVDKVSPKWKNQKGRVAKRPRSF